MLKPSDINFMHCLPQNREAFQLAFSDQQRHYVRAHLPEENPEAFAQRKLWELYTAEVLDPYIKLKKQFMPRGFHFMDSVSLGAFQQNLNSFHVTILFSHCSKDGEEEIEFHDQMANVQKLLKAIPDGFDRVLDLCVCGPVNLAETLRSKRRKAVIKSSDNPIDFIYWLYLYATIFETILTKKITYYSEAIELALDKLR